MTITVRNNTLRASIAVSLLLLIGFFVALLDVYLYHMPGTTFLDLVRGSGGRLVSIAGLTFLLIFSFTAGGLLPIFFFKNVALVRFFFIFFLFSLSPPEAQAAQLIILAQHAPPYFVIIVKTGI